MIITFITFLLGLLLYIAYEQNNHLQYQIEQRDTLLSIMRHNDSVYNQTINSYSSTLNFYIKEKSIKIEDKYYTLDEFIDEYLEILSRQSNSERGRILFETAFKEELDSTKKYKLLYYQERQKSNAYQNQYENYYDTTRLLKTILLEVKNKYGVEYTVLPLDTTNNSRGFYFNFSKADSGILLLKHYRDKIHYDTTEHIWRITVYQR